MMALLFVYIRYEVIGESQVREIRYRIRHRRAGEDACIKIQSRLSQPVNVETQGMDAHVGLFRGPAWQMRVSISWKT